MADLAEILGAVLRNVTHSRVISDLFSKDIAQEYQRDPILIDFPVPRLEIKQASIQLRFAINTVERKEVDALGTARPLVSSHAARLAEEIRTEFILKSSERDKIIKMLVDKGIDLDKALLAAIERGAMADSKALDAALSEQPEELIRNIHREVTKLLLEDPDLKPMLIRHTGVKAIREHLRSKVAGMMQQMLGKLSEALEREKRQAISVDVAVTRNELSGMPEPSLSQITLVAEIRNYEWVDTGEVEDKPVLRLRPE